MTGEGEKGNNKKSQAGNARFHKILQVVTKSIPAKSIVSGNPAKLVDGNDRVFYKPR